MLLFLLSSKYIHIHARTHTTLSFPVQRIGQYRRRKAFLAVQWLRLGAYTAGGSGLFPSRKRKTCMSSAWPKKKFFLIKKKKDLRERQGRREESSNPTLQDLSSLSSPTTNYLINLWSSSSPLIDTAWRMLYEM